ncbi:MAG: helix-turn-helix domain-containing protein [Saprospiraceae bacterium]|nr:helix-turn-helix domain-containing protein [Saprospiraceae bacterium]
MKLLIDFLLVAGILANGVVLYLLLRQRKPPFPKQILSLIFLGLFFVSFNAYGELHEIKWIYLTGYLLSDPIGYLLGPLLLLYINSIYRPDFKFSAKVILHFIPLLLYFFGITLPYVIVEAGNFALPVYLLHLMGSDLFLQFQAVYLLCYTGLSWRALGFYRKRLKRAFSHLEDKDLRWVRHLLLGIILTISVHLGITLYEWNFDLLDWSISYLSTGILILFIIYLAYYGLEQSRILLPSPLLEPDSIVSPTTVANSPSTNPLQHFREVEIETMHRRILSLLEEQAVYLDEELTLGALAQQIPTTDKKLSALLNHHLNTSFYDLINSYRIQAVKDKLANKEFEHLTILAIAFDSGFKSKTSFNRIFKKETGMSPSAYKKHRV